MTARPLLVSVGLPHNLPDVDPKTLLGWAVEAEELGFDGVGTTDRLVYRGYESLLTLTAVAAVTSRIQVLTGVLIGPVHSNAALLAKQTATLDRLSGGRLTLGLAVGARGDDYAASGVDHSTRGAALDAQLSELRRIWAGERRGIAGSIGPTPVQPGGPPILLGGQSPRALRRVLEHGTGWISGGAGPRAFAAGLQALAGLEERVGAAFAGPTAALAYVSLGAQAEAGADRFVQDYYGFAPPLAAMIRGQVLTTPEALDRELGQFAELGCDQVVLVPCTPDRANLTRTADVALGLPVG